MRIESLADHPELAPSIARWQFHEWSHQYPGDSLAEWIRRVKGQMSEDSIPMTMVAFNDLQPIGSAVILRCHMHTHEGLSPWLARVFVRPEFRSHGVASAMVREAMDKARKLGVENLYLYTRCAQGLYERLGWERLESTHYQGRQVTIMTARLGD